MDEGFRVPLCCPLCGILMRGKSTHTYYKYNTCMNCFIQFIEGREERWTAGWRPSERDVKLYKESLYGSDC